MSHGLAQAVGHFLLALLLQAELLVTVLGILLGLPAGTVYLPGQRIGAFSALFYKFLLLL